MELDDAVAFARTTNKSILSTIRANGRPQSSNVMHHMGDDGVVRISITADRAKYANLVREPWASLHVSSDDFWSYVVLEADVTVAPVAAEVADATVDQLVTVYRAIMGADHDDWDAYRAAMVTERRTVVHLTPTRAYGMLQLGRPSGT